MQVRIYSPAKNTMQSGRGKTGVWVLEFEPQAPRQVEPLMGWVSSSDTLSQTRLQFDSKEAAIAYAQSKGYIYALEDEQQRRIKPKAYSDNFDNKRLLRWTH